MADDRIAAVTALAALAGGVSDARQRAAKHLAEIHGNVSADAYSVAFEAFIRVLLIGNPVEFAREIMAWRLRLRKLSHLQAAVDDRSMETE